MHSRARLWLADVAVGGVVGGITGAIAAVNFVIFSGIDGGYEASIAEVFRQNTLVGIVTLAILGFGPVCGVVIRRRARRNRERSHTV
jgi:hypothetical protein